jgi:hypothetical protein
MQSMTYKVKGLFKFTKDEDKHFKTSEEIKCTGITTRT